MQKDPHFGNIEWTGDAWEAKSVPVPFLKPFGDRVRAHLTKQDLGQLPAPGTLPLTIAEESRRHPTDDQRAAWTSILEHGDAMRDDILDALIEEYLRQRPTRVKYWQALRGDKLLDHSLPAHVDRAVMQTLVLPLSATIEAADDRDQGIAAYITFLATWFSEPINVYIRRRHVTEVAPLGYFMNRRQPSIVTPEFGTLRRRKGSPNPWAGELRLEPFTSFAAIAVDRSGWDESYTPGEQWDSGLPWDVARGQALLMVYAPPNQPPVPAQAAALNQFRDNHPTASAHLLDALFHHYQQTAPERRAAYRPTDRNLAVPTIKHPQDLAPITELKEVAIFPPESPDRTPIGFVFRGPWTGTEGLGLRWCNSQVEQIGRPRDVAEPKRGPA